MQWETYSVRPGPSLVRARIHHPQLGKRVVPGRLAAPDAIVMAEVAALCRVERLNFAGADIIERFPGKEALLPGKPKGSVSIVDYGK